MNKNFRVGAKNRVLTKQFFFRPYLNYATSPHFCYSAIIWRRWPVHHMETMVRYGTVAHYTAKYIAFCGVYAAREKRAIL